MSLASVCVPARRQNDGIWRQVVSLRHAKIPAILRAKPALFSKHIRLQEANMSYKTATRRRRRRLLTSDTKAHRNSAANTRGCLACRLKPTRKHFATKNEQKFKVTDLGELCKISKFYCAMQAEITAQ
jgi:hypothetical protein